MAIRKSMHTLVSVNTIVHYVVLRPLPYTSDSLNSPRIASQRSFLSKLLVAPSAHCILGKSEWLGYFSAMVEPQRLAVHGAKPVPQLQYLGRSLLSLEIALAAAPPLRRLGLRIRPARFGFVVGGWHHQARRTAAASRCSDRKPENRRASCRSCCGATASDRSWQRRRCRPG